jgi:hypothetical protein
MVMKRFLLALVAIAPLAAGACNKPTPEECRQAISHMEELLGTEATSRTADIEGEVRRCRGGSTKEAVTCAIKAKTLDELKACTFMSPKGKKADKDTVAPPPSEPAPTPSTPGAPPTTPPPSAPPPSAPTPSPPGK